MANPTTVPFQSPIGGDQFGPHLNTIGTAYTVVNTDAGTAQSGYNNPYGIAAGNDTYSAKVILITNPGFTYLDLCHIISATAAPTVTTSCKVRAFGMPNESSSCVGFPGMPNQYDTTASRWPELLKSNSTYYTSTLKLRVQGLWVPLFHPTTGNQEQDFGATLHIQTGTTDFSDTSTNVFGQIGGPIYYCAGCTKILVLVSQAAVITNGNASMVLGRFIK